VKRVLAQYRTLLIKTYSDQFQKPKIAAAKVNYKIWQMLKHCLVWLQLSPS
jgi:hypothetical protein